jgi:hypothetical protein
MMRRTVLALVMAAIAAVSFGAHAQQVRYDDRSAALARLDELMALLEEMRGAIDRTVFDADELAFELAFEDAETIDAWVVDHIAYEPYAGLLRGPDGTLRARAGNALDQATLLARLLGDAGYETRIALATLEDDAADRLLARTALDPPPAPPIGDVDALRALLVRLSEIVASSEEDLLASLEATLSPPPIRDEPLRDELRAVAEGIESALSEAGVVLGEGAATVLRDEARAYAWTQYRLGPEDPWASAHPTGFAPAAPLEPERVLEAEIPEELQHRVRIQAWIEQKRGDELTRVPVMAAWERPAANAAGVVLEYANYPNAAPGGDVGGFDLERVAEETEVFAPYFEGRLAPGAQIFDLDGRAIAPDVANNVAAGVFRAVAGAAESAAGAIGAMGSEGDGEGDDLLALSGHGIDVTLVAPDGRETLHRRWILDRIGAERRATDTIEIAPDAPDPARAVLGRHRIMLSTGALPPGYLLDRTLERLLEARDFFAYVVGQMAEPDPAADLDEDMLGGPTGLDHLAAFDTFERTVANVAAGPGYRPAPAVLVLSERVAPAGDVELVRSIDIAANPRRVLRDAEDGALDPGAALRRGVWETLVEREMLFDAEAGAVRLAAGDAAPPYRLLRPGDSVDATEFGLGAEAAARLSDELARGALVLLPTSPPAELEAWWRVEPTTGAALGVTADGRGQAMVEYEIQLLDNAMTLMFAVKGLKDCQGMGGTAEACCLLKAHINNVTGLGLGGIIGKLGGAGSGLLFTMTTGVAGTDFAGGMGLSCEAFGAGG